MNEFVEECRKEWKRLGVPDPVAGEMAADLAADLEEAEAEGVSAEQVLGSGAFDPRSFAAAWAAERGVIQRSSLPSRRGTTRSARVVAVIGTLALVVAVAGAALVIADSPSETRRLAFTPPEGAASVAVWPRPDTLPPRVMSRTPDGRILLLPLPPPPDALVFAVDTDDSGVDGRLVGSVLLLVGLAGLIPATLYLLWRGPGWGHATARS